jgi:hypothetical protein
MDARKELLQNRKEENKKRICTETQEESFRREALTMATITEK